ALGASRRRLDVELAAGVGVPLPMGPPPPHAASTAASDRQAAARDEVARPISPPTRPIPGFFLRPALGCPRGADKVPERDSLLESREAGRPRRRRRARRARRRD